VRSARPERGSDQTHLCVNTSDQAGAGTTVDEQTFGACPEQPVFGAQDGPDPCSVGVDDLDARRGDRDVIDVGLGSRDPSVAHREWALIG
jgi:hypothetical protein